MTTRWFPIGAASFVDIAERDLLVADRRPIGTFAEMEWLCCMMRLAMT